MTTRQPTPGVHENFAASIAETRPQPLGYITPAALEQLRMGIDCQPIHKDPRHGFTVPIFDHPPRMPEPITPPPPQSHLEVPEGWKLVPIEPTDWMIENGILAYSGKCEESYRAMVAVAPPPPVSNMAAADEDLEFARRYSSSSSYEDLARVLSHRLRQMDKRAKAANARADRLEAELRAASTSPESNVEPCQHKEWSTGYDHCQCKQCGSFRTDSGWGIASHTWFKSRTEAEFYQKNGRLPDPLPSSLKPGVRS